MPKDGSLKLQFFEVEDLCRLIEAIVEKKPDYHVINTGNVQATDAAEWVKLCYSVLGKTPDIRYVLAEYEQRQYFPFRDYKYYLDVTRQTELLTDLKPLEIGLKESYEWFKNNRELIVRKDYFRYIEENF